MCKTYLAYVNEKNDFLEKYVWYHFLYEKNHIYI